MASAVSTKSNSTSNNALERGKSARVDIRTTAEMRDLIEQAATIQGLTTSEYVKATLAEHAQAVVEQYETRRMSDRDRNRFLDLLEHPPAPNEALRSAATGFRQAIESGELIL